MIWSQGRGFRTVIDDVSSGERSRSLIASLFCLMFVIDFLADKEATSNTNNSDGSNRSILDG
jgi:hypothetical protein